MVKVSVLPMAWSGAELSQDQTEYKGKLQLTAKTSKG